MNGASCYRVLQLLMETQMYDINCPLCYRVLQLLIETQIYEINCALCYRVLQLLIETQMRKIAVTLADIKQLDSESVSASDRLNTLRQSRHGRVGYALLLSILIKM